MASPYAWADPEPACDGSHPPGEGQLTGWEGPKGVEGPTSSLHLFPQVCIPSREDKPECSPLKQCSHEVGTLLLGQGHQISPALPPTQTSLPHFLGACRAARPQAKPSAWAFFSVWGWLPPSYAVGSGVGGVWDKGWSPQGSPRVGGITWGLWDASLTLRLTPPMPPLSTCCQPQ